MSNPHRQTHPRRPRQQRQSDNGQAGILPVNVSGYPFGARKPAVFPFGHADLFPLRRAVGGVAHVVWVAHFSPAQARAPRILARRASRSISSAAMARLIFSIRISILHFRQYCRV